LIVGLCFISFESIDLIKFFIILKFQEIFDNQYKSF